MYIKLSGDYILHLRPGKGTVLPSPVIAGRGRRSSYELSSAAADIVALCNGRRSLRDLAFESRGIAAQDLSTFIAFGLEEGFLDAFDGPQTGEIEVIGSRDFDSPNHFIVELTDGCNLSCIHCYRNSQTGPSSSLPVLKLTGIFSEMRERGVRSLELTGGEPLLHPDIRAVIKEAAACFRIVGILSNGWLVDDELAALLGEHRDQIFVQIDLDGPRADVHDSLRGRPGSFQKAVWAIRALVRHDVFCRAVMNVYPPNLPYVEETLLLAQDLGAACFSSSVVMDLGRARAIPSLSADQLAMYRDLLRKLSDSYARYYFPTVDLLERLGKIPEGCGAGLNKLVLGPAGKVRFCVLMPESDVVLGDLAKESYRDFLQRADLYAFHHIRPPGPDYCDGCRYSPFCGSCIARPFELLRRHVAEGTEFHCSWNRKWNLFGRWPVKG